MPYGIARFIGRRQPAIFAALPPTAFLPRKNSTGLFGEGKSDDGKEEDAGILAYAKDDDAVSADLHRRKACVSLSSEGIRKVFHIINTFWKTCSVLTNGLT